VWAEGLRTRPDAFLLTEDELLAIPDAQFVKGIVANTYLGAFAGETLQGFVVARRGGVTRLRHTADIGPLYVIPTLQGCGAGRALMQAVLDQLIADGVLQVELAVDQANNAAFALYTAIGFQVFGTRPRSVILGSDPRTDYLMMKALDGVDLGLA
jgi:ribosomal protein S18 acetylase RimI-like enzyme